jgi:hypothetical protein
MPDANGGNGLTSLRYRVDGGDWQTEKLRPDLLPRYIVIYTTGNEQVWLDIFGDGYGVDGETAVAGLVAEAAEDDAYLRELPGHRPTVSDDDIPVDFDFDTPLLFIRSQRLPLVALCGLLASRQHQNQTGNEILHPVLESIGLETTQSFSLRIRAQPSLTPPAQLEIVTRLANVADHAVQQGADRLFVFNMAAQNQRQAQSEPSIYSQ